MTAIPKDQLMNELLPGLQALFDTEMESHAVDVLKGAVKESNEEFVSREVYARVIAGYEKKIDKIKEDIALKENKALRSGAISGVQQAANLVESMAQELGNSNLLNAVVLAIRSMEISE